MVSARGPACNAYFQHLAEGNISPSAAYGIVQEKGEVLCYLTGGSVERWSHSNHEKRSLYLAMGTEV